ncbi:hypothetical protein ISN44_As07g021210, partial [Arabidopsis suecica]
FPSSWEFGSTLHIVDICSTLSKLSYDNSFRLHIQSS